MLTNLAKKYLYQLSLIFAGLIVYCNILFNEFVWEDLSLIIANPKGHSFYIFSPENMFNLEGQFRPITALYSAITYLIFHENPAPYHLLQIILHIINAILIFTIFKKLLNKEISFLIALLFTVHPINVGSITYFGSFNSPLFVFFGLFALLMSSESSFKSHTLVIGFLLLLSVLTKETGILFLVFIPFYQLLFQRKYLRRSLSISCTILTIYIIMKSLFSTTLAPIYPTPVNQITLFQRLFTIPAVVFYYIKTFFWPIKLAIYQQWVVPSPSFLGFYVPLIFDITFFGTLLFIGRHIFRKNRKIFPAYIFFFIWFTAGLFLHSQIIPLNLTVSDHWFYFPLIGLCGLVGLIIQIFNLDDKKNKKLTIVIFTIVLCALSVRTVIRNRDWRENLILFEHDSKVYDNYILEDFVATEYFYNSKYDLALQHFYRSLKLQPQESIYLSIAGVYKYEGDYAKAKEFYLKAIKHHKSNLLVSYQELCGLLLVTDTQKNTGKMLRTALKKYPEDPHLLALLALQKYKENNYDEAITIARKALLSNSEKITEYAYDVILRRRKIDSTYVLFIDE